MKWIQELEGPQYLFSGVSEIKGGGLDMLSEV